MQWTDEAIVLATKKHGETGAVAWVLAQKHGPAAGIVHGAQSKANRGILQPGNVVSVAWNARLPEHLGNFKAELLIPHAAHIMADAARLSGLAAACALVQRALPERHPYPKFYAQFHAFLEQLAEGADWLPAYVFLELALLAESGFGLDLSICAATGKSEDLIYVSPKSGRAVSREAGEPYKEKLLPLPKILWRDANREHRIPSLDPAQSLCDSQDVLAGLRLTGYFLESWLLAPHNRKLPAARGRMIEMINKEQKIDESV